MAFKKAEMEVVKLSTEDVVTSSGSGEINLPIVG